MTTATSLTSHGAPSSAPVSTRNLRSEANVPSNPTSKVVLSPGEWLRAVSNFDAPFGFDRMPTVWG